MNRAFTAFANSTAKFVGKPYVFIAAFAVVAIWAMLGPAFRYSDTWQLVINTSTTIITFLMVFLIQNSQNRHDSAIHAKLDELIRCGEADNKYIGIEHLTDEELDVILDEVEQYAIELHRARRKRKAHAMEN
ncbi:MAG: low affinity iron permease family protein [Hyphomonadaceae bacterium]